MNKNSILRVEKYLGRLSTAKRYNQECIHSFLEGWDGETPLLVADLKALLQFASSAINTEQPELLMKLADDYAEACFDQGLHQRTTDDKPEAAREKLEKELRRLHARVQELEAAKLRLGEDSKRLDWLDQKNKGHPYYTGYVWQKEDYENNRGLVAAIQSKKEMMSARQAIDAAMRITQDLQQ